MVLSLAFIIAFIGAAVALLIGILIFSEVSDSLVCPAPAGGGGTVDITGYDNLGSIGSSADANYFDDGDPFNFTSVTGIINEGAFQNGTATGGNEAVIVFAPSLAVTSDFDFLHQGTTGNNITSINFWMKGDVDGAPAYPVLNTGSSDSGGTGLSVWTQSGTTTYFTIYEGGGTSLVDQSSIAQIPDDASWHMITYVYDKGNMTSNFGFMCLDASCTNTGTIIGTPFSAETNSAANPLTLGGGTGYASGPVENEFDVDEIIIWQGYQLTQSDIDNMYNSGSGATGIGIASGSQVLAVTFDEGSQQVVVSGGSGGQGSDECEQAKDTAWTVIGILPVALFFALFAIFGSLGGRQS